MSISAFFKSKKTVTRMCKGPLGLYMEAYANLLVSEGHCCQSGARNIRVAADYSLWLAKNQQRATDVNEDSIVEYETFRQKHRHPFLTDHAALNRLLNLLRSLNVIKPATPIVLVTPHVLRHTAAMELLSAGVDTTVIAMWLGHESTQTTEVYMHAHMALKEAALAKVEPLNRRNILHYQPGDKLLNFLTSL